MKWNYLFVREIDSEIPVSGLLRVNFSIRKVLLFARASLTEAFEPLVRAVGSGGIQVELESS